MTDGIMLQISDDGKATLYESTYDITIHCDSEKEQHEVMERLNSMNWIPVSERLPEEDACYLVTTSGTNNDIIDIAYYTEGIWHKASRIKAWMPLPEPYRGEQE